MWVSFKHILQAILLNVFIVTLLKGASFLFHMLNNVYSTFFIKFCEPFNFIMTQNSFKEEETGELINK